MGLFLCYIGSEKQVSFNQTPKLFRKKHRNSKMFGGLCEKMAILLGFSGQILPAYVAV